jgi:hypothetical protein
MMAKKKRPVRFLKNPIRYIRLHLAIRKIKKELNKGRENKQ